MVTRREALHRLGTIGAGVLGAAAVCQADPLDDNGRSSLGPLGVQLYTVRDHMRDGVEATLARVAEIGYQEVEFAGYFERTPVQIRDALQAAGLAAPSTHVPIDTTGDDWQATLDAATAIGHSYVVVPFVPADMRQTLDDWRRIADRFNTAGEAARTAGIQFAYHNHDFEFTPINGQVPFDVLCEATDPQLVQIELDLYWIVHGGGDPLALFERWPGRTSLVHVKDRTADGTMVDVGAGAIDWRAIFERREEAGIRHYFVEHDRPGDAFASIDASLRFLSALEL